MRRTAVSLAVIIAAFLSAPMTTAPSTQPRQLTFEDRVRAQEAIERVYYSHQIGAKKPFEEAVPRETVERKVRTYLKQSVALEEIWNTPVTADALRGELERIARSTRFPQRLHEIYVALGEDPILLQECFARSFLVDRLTRNFFALDERFHEPEREEAERLRERLLSGEIDVLDEHDGRSVVQITLAATGENRAEPLGGDDGFPSLVGELSHIEVEAEDYDRWRRQIPLRIGEIGPVVEEREVFLVRILLEEREGLLTVAIFSVAKTPWDVWWSHVEGELDEHDASQVALGVGALPAPGTSGRATDTESDAEGVLGLQNVIAASCAPEDTWDNGILDDLPEGRRGFTAVWTGSLMVVWGGYGGAFLGTGGRYDPLTDTWAPTSTSNAPSARSSHTAVWTGSVMVVWGGRVSDGSPPNTGGRYDPLTNTWTSVSGTNAPSWLGITAVWTGSQMIVWGGGTNAGGRYDPATDTWTPTSTTGAPSARIGPTAVWTGSLMVVWGGFGGGPALNTGGRYDPLTDTWTSTSTISAPSPRWGHTAVWTGILMVVWGGDGVLAGSMLNTGGRYDPVTDTWTPTSTTNVPSRREYHTALWTGDLMIVWGGLSGGNTGGRYDPLADAWTPTSTIGAPSARFDHTTIWTGNEMVVWGGYLSGTRFNTGGRYDAVSDTWLPTSTINAPSARSDHTAVWTGSQMIIWGGSDSNGSGLVTGGRYDPLTDAWTQTSTTGAHPGGIGHSAVWTGSLMVVWGGFGGGLVLNTGGRYNPLADTWTSTSTTTAPSARYGHTAVWTGSQMIIWGGYDNSGGRYDPFTDTWMPTSTANAPVGYSRHSAVWTGSQMIVWGGGTNTGGRYDAVSDTWLPTSTINAPSGRASHTAVWTGSLMIIWGGFGGNLLHTGGRYDPFGGSLDHDSDGYSECDGDCNDSNPGAYPGAQELCDGLDNDCDGVVPAGEADADGDGYRMCGGDCDDGNASLNPAATELPGNLQDENCDGFVACDPAAGWRNHGLFVKCVVKECERLAASGLVTTRQCAVLVSKAARLRRR